MAGHRRGSCLYFRRRGHLSRRCAPRGAPDQQFQYPAQRRDPAVLSGVRAHAARAQPAGRDHRRLSADAATLVISTILSNGASEPPLLLRAVWGLTLGVPTAALVGCRVHVCVNNPFILSLVRYRQKECKYGWIDITHGSLCSAPLGNSSSLLLRNAGWLKIDRRPQLSGAADAAPLFIDGSSCLCYPITFHGDPRGYGIEGFRVVERCLTRPGWIAFHDHSVSHRSPPARRNCRCSRAGLKTRRSLHLPSHLRFHHVSSNRCGYLRAAVQSLYRWVCATLRDARCV